jgi:hypothetical protein
MSERIGSLFPRAFGFQIRCGVGRCNWYHDLSSHDRDKAEEMLRSHVAIAHPQPIHIYRPEPE